MMRYPPRGRFSTTIGTRPTTVRTDTLSLYRECPAGTVRVGRGAWRPSDPTFSEARLCVVCGSSLTGRRRQSHHCSDQCRAEGARAAHRRRIAARLDEIAETVEALRQELRLQENSTAFSCAATELGVVVKSTNSVRPSVSTTALERGLHRIIAEIQDGLRHGYFEFNLTCEVVSQSRRRLTLRAGKNYQFLIPEDDCLTLTAPMVDSRDGSDSNAA
jgi:hypothetical protein